MVFPLSAPVTAELAPGALDFANDDDTESETSSDDFDTTLRPQDMILSQRMSTENRETDLLMRESLDTIRPVIVKKALSASRLLSQAYPASGIPSPVLSPHFGHGSRRKPVPKLEDYDRLYPTQHQPKTVTTGQRNLMLSCIFRSLTISFIYAPRSKLSMDKTPHTISLDPFQ